MIENTVIQEIIPDALGGERLDRVVSMLGGCSRSIAASLVADGAVALDGVAQTQRSFRVEPGMALAFSPPERQELHPIADPGVAIDIVHADDHLAVVNKPAGLVVHPGAGRPDATMVNGLLALFPEIATVGDRTRPGIVHRLDADTSGLLVVARTPNAYAALVAALSAREVERVYTAVVNGTVQDDRGVIDAPIGRSAQRRTRMAVVADGREARTHYEVMARSTTEPPASLLTCRLETGRTHQIRVHLSAIGHAVIGDRTYGVRGGTDGFDRVALHARRLSFVHPESAEIVEFEAPEPPDLVGLIGRLGLAASR